MPIWLLWILVAAAATGTGIGFYLLTNGLFNIFALIGLVVVIVFAWKPFIEPLLARFKSEK